MKFDPIDRDLAESAVQLFERRYEQIRSVSPVFELNLFEEPSHAETLLDWASNGASVVAHEDGVVHGYIAGRFIKFYGATKALYAPEWAHCVSDEDDKLLTKMYTWLGREGHLSGTTVQIISMFVDDARSRDAMANLEFGVHQIEGVFGSRAAMNGPAMPADVVVRAATPDDLPAIVDLDRKLWEHLNRPPVSLGLDLTAYPHADLDAENAKYKVPRQGAYISVAERGGELVGFMSCRNGAQESRALRNMSVPHVNGAFIREDMRGAGIAQALLSDVLRWAKGESAPNVTVDFESTNPEAAGFWLSQDLRPLVSAFTRRISL